MTEGNYRVVRFYTDFSAGLLKDTLASGLSLEEAEKLAQENAGVPGEEIAIQDENQTGLYAEVQSYLSDTET